MKTTKLIDVADIIYGYAFNSKLFNTSGEGRPLIRIRDVNTGFSNTYTTENAPEKYLVRNGDFLIGMDGNFEIVKWANGEALLNQRVCKIIPKSIKPDYLFYLLSPILKSIENKTHSTTVKHLSAKELNKISFELPNGDQQSKIANELSNLHRMLTLKREALEGLDSLVKSRFNEMFGDPMDEKKWNSKFTEVVIFNPKKSEVKKDMEIEASFVPMEAIGTDGSFSIKKSGKIKDFYKGYTYFKDGDVIFAKITPCFENGKIAIANHCTNKIGFGTTEFHVARPISGKTNAEWVMNLLRNDSLHTYASSKMTGSAGQKRIQTPFFEKLGVYLPPLELQNRFADFVHLVDKSRFDQTIQEKARISPMSDRI